jgi:hypothetical protein
LVDFLKNQSYNRLMLNEIRPIAEQYFASQPRALSMTHLRHLEYRRLILPQYRDQIPAVTEPDEAQGLLVLESWYNWLSLVEQYTQSVESNRQSLRRGPSLVRQGLTPTPEALDTSIKEEQDRLEPAVTHGEYRGLKYKWEMILRNPDLLTEFAPTTLDLGARMRRLARPTIEGGLVYNTNRLFPKDGYNTARTKSLLALAPDRGEPIDPRKIDPAKPLFRI